MKAVVVYESMYGNTHLIADAIGEGLGAKIDVHVVPVGEATVELMADTDLLVVGGPTHAHGMTRERTRQAAVAAGRKPEAALEIDPDAEGPGLRDWFDALEHVPNAGAAFDTRFDMPAALTGRASRGIARRLRHHGCTLVAEPKSFFVTKGDHLAPDELAHARQWGAELATTMAGVLNPG